MSAPTARPLSVVAEARTATTVHWPDRGATDARHEHSKNVNFTVDAAREKVAHALQRGDQASADYWIGYADQILALREGSSS